MIKRFTGINIALATASAASAIQPHPLIKPAVIDPVIDPSAQTQTRLVVKRRIAELRSNLTVGESTEPLSKINVIMACHVITKLSTNSNF